MIVARGFLLALTAASIAPATPTPTPTPKTCTATGACANLRLASCEKLNVTKSITHLDLSYNSLEHLNATCLPTSTTLTKANLSRNNFETLDVNTFLHQPNLTNVDLSHNYIVSVPPLTFNSTNLTRLILAGNLLAFIPPLKADFLRVLDLRDNLITRVTNTATFASMRRLEALYLTGNTIEAIDADVFKDIPNVGLRLCKTDATATLEGVLSNLTLVECSTSLTSTSSHNLLFLIGIATLVSCVCAVIVVTAIYLVVNIPRRRPPGGVEMRALTPARAEANVEPPRRVFRPHNDGYELPLAGNEVDRLPMAPTPPTQDVQVDVHKPSTSAGPSHHTYLKMLHDADDAPVKSAPQPAVRRSLIREFSSRELPPIPRADDEYDPVGEPPSNTVVNTVGDGRNSFSDFAESRAASTRRTAPPVPLRPKYVIQ